MKRSFLPIPILIVCCLLLSTPSAQSEEARCDVVVVGGGSAGIVAAAQSARAGAGTILIESGFQLGGTATTGGINFPGLFHAWGKQVIAGIGWELVTETIRLDNGTLPDFSVPTGKAHWEHQIRVNLPLYSVVAEDLCLKSGVEIRYFEAPMELVALKDRPDGLNWLLVTVSQGEKRTILCKQLIDCTGNGTLCAMAGAERMREEVTQPGTFQYVIDTGIDPKTEHRQEIERRYREALESGELKPGDVSGSVMGYLTNTTRNYVYEADNSSGKLRTETDIRGRQSLLRMLKFIQTLPGGEKAKLISMPAEVGVRETWRVKGRCVISHEDYISAKQWDDSLAYSFYPIDLHVNEKGVASVHLKEGRIPTIPLRALLPEGVENILVAGRCISSDRLANSALRVQASCMAGGQVAGAVAALAAKQNASPSSLNLDEIKRLLKQHSAIVPE